MLCMLSWWEHNSSRTTAAMAGGLLMGHGGADLEPFVIL
jgi:hypothetical protein